jgi:hypothetical protein
MSLTELTVTGNASAEFQAIIHFFGQYLKDNPIGLLQKP